MPRDGSGVYTLPANSLVSTGTASSAYFNNTLTDLQSALTQSLSKDGQTPLTGALKAYAGTVTVPGYAFSGDSSTGWYQSATGYITSTIAGVKGIETSAKGFNDGAPATIASATTTDLSTIPSNNVTVTGTTTITGLGTTDAGITKKLTFSGALTLTYNVTSLILPTAANITTAAGDTAIMLSLGSGNWKCLNYSKASGKSLAAIAIADISATGTPSSTTYLRGDGAWSAVASPITAGTAQNTTSGTAINFTSIPAGTKRITVMLSGVSTTGTSDLLIQLGTSGGYVSTGYAAYSGSIVGGAVGGSAYTTGHPLQQSTGSTAAGVETGIITFINLNGNIWVGSGTNIYGGGGVNMNSSTVTLGATLDRLRLTTAGGTDTFDAGSMNILWE